MKVIMMSLSFCLLTATMNAAEEKIVSHQPHNNQSEEVISPHKGLCYGAATCCCTGCCTGVCNMQMSAVAKDCLFYTNGSFTGYHFEAGVLERIALSAKSCAPHSLSQIPSSLLKMVSIIAHLNPFGGALGTSSCCLCLGCALCVASFCYASEKEAHTQQQKSLTEHVVKQD